MKTFHLDVTVDEYDSFDELEFADRELLKHAESAASKAYAPYSQYFVGAAVRLTNNRVFTGSNQENAAYPLGLCAERVAVFSAASHFPDVPVEAIAVFVKAENFSVDSPVSPCGACRQVLAEYEEHHHQQIKVILKGETGKIYMIKSIESLLPLTFYEGKLKKNT